MHLFGKRPPRPALRLGARTLLLDRRRLLVAAHALVHPALWVGRVSILLCRGGSTAALHHLRMVPNNATANSAQHGMMASIMAGDCAGSAACEAANGVSLPWHRHEGSRGEQGEGKDWFHG